MQPTQLSHFQINVRGENFGFYRDLFTFLGWKLIYEDAETLALAEKNGVSFWFVSGAKDVVNDYDGPGINHIGIGVAAQEDVDSAAGYLTRAGVPHLFDTPRHRPDFSREPNTYYQVMFESPDRILWEIVYIGLKS